MRLDFDLHDVRHTQFGVGRDDSDGQGFSTVAVDRSIQSALRDMANATVDSLERIEDGPTKYEPSERYGSTAHLYLPIEDDMVETFRQLHEAANPIHDGNALRDTARMFCYFARFIDVAGRSLTAVRRSSQFKSLGKSRLMQLLPSDTLTLVDNPMFKLDNDFDLLVDSERVHILRPSGFEFTGRLREAVLEAVPGNVAEISPALPFVDFGPIEQYASKRPRAARYLASIRTQGWTKGIDKIALERLCNATGVDFSEADGQLSVSDDHVLGFLEVLDRRRYEIELVPAAPERFRAPSRQKLGR